MLNITSNSNGFTVEAINNTYYPDNGTLTFGPNLTIALNGLEGRRDLREKTFTLAAAGTLVGAENVLSAAVATPGLPPSINAVVSVDGNAVKVRFKALGLSIIFR